MPIAKFVAFSGKNLQISKTSNSSHYTVSKLAKGQTKVLNFANVIRRVQFIQASVPSFPVVNFDLKLWKIGLQENQIISQRDTEDVM